jgi:hypothetical protein
MIMPTDRSADKERYSSPPAKEFVLVFMDPKIHPPTKPPRLPIELIRPIAAAAADPVRKLDGKGQKPGR